MFLETVHLFYLFIFLIFIILVRHYGLKKSMYLGYFVESNKYWRIMHMCIILTCVALTAFLQVMNFVGPNIYGLCHFTTIFNTSNPLSPWTLIIAISYLCICIFFLSLGLFAYQYLARQLPNYGPIPYM
jgi:hypothetical protein